MKKKKTKTKKKMEYKNIGCIRSVYKYRFKQCYNIQTHIYIKSFFKAPYALSTEDGVQGPEHGG